MKNLEVGQIVFYMNNPAVVLRIVSDEFSEVRISPKYARDLDGSMWCEECQVGGWDGVHLTHRCDAYDEIIDAINDADDGIPIIAENRLLASAPIESVKYAEISKWLGEASELLDATLKLNAKYMVSEEVINRKHAELERVNSELEKSVDKMQRTLSNLKENIAEANAELRRKTSDLSKLPDEGKRTIPAEELERLIRDSYILQSLKNGGLDNWEWYGESHPSDEDIEDYLNTQML